MVRNLCSDISRIKRHDLRSPIMLYKSFPSGSEWRRWDLHVHTPASYVSEFGDNWNEYVSALIDAIHIHKIEVIATADYFTINGYERLLDYYDPSERLLRQGGSSAKVTLLPGVELRLDVFNEEEDSINLHYLFNPKLFNPNFIKRNFLEKLSVIYRGKTITLHEPHMVAIGYSIETGAEPDYTREYDFTEPRRNVLLKNAFRGITLAQRDISGATATIKAILGEDKTNGTFLSVVAGKGHGSLDSLDWFEEKSKILSRSGVTRENLTHGANLIFSNSGRDRDFYLGKRPDTTIAEIEERFGGQKACVWGSDCHRKETLLHPSSGNSSDYTWMKADPSFEGLQQIVFEPAERVVIPGFDCLRTFSQAHEAVLKAECGAAWESYFLRSHWRMIFRVYGRFQQKMAEKLKRSLARRGVSLVHLFRFPRITINHGIVLYRFIETEQEIEFTAYDPNIPEHPVKLIYEKKRRVFTFAPNIYWGGGVLSVMEIFTDFPY